MNKTLRVAGLSVEPGKRAKQLVKIGEDTDGSDINVPFIVVNGAKDGPILTLIAGEHGDEYCGQESVRVASLKVEPKTLSGAIIAVPNCNPLGYRLGTYKNLKVYDTGVGDNMNDYSTRSASGTFDQRVAKQVWEEALSKADAIINLHDGATHWIARYIGLYYTAETRQLGERALAIAKAFGAGYPIAYIKLPAYSAEYSCLIDIAKQGIPSIIPEVGGMRMLWKDDVERAVKGITNVMMHLKMMEGTPEPSKQILFHELAYVRSNHGGVLKPKFSPLDIPLTVKKREVLGTITDLLGNELEVLTSPADGVIYCARAHCSVHTGDWLYGVGVSKT